MCTTVLLSLRFIGRRSCTIAESKKDLCDSGALNALHPVEGATQRRRRVHRSIALLAAISFFHSTANATTLPIIPLFVLALGGTALTVGVVIAAAEFLPMWLALSAGAFTDRAGPKLPLQIGAASLLIGSVLRVFAHDVSVLIVAQVVMGFSNLIGFLAAQSYISVISAQDEQAQHFGSWSFVTSFGQTVGPLAGGILASFFSRGESDLVAGYRAVFVLTIVLGVATLILGWLLPAVPGREEVRLSPTHTVKAAARLIALPTVAIGAWASLALMMNSGIRRSFFPVYAAVRLGLTPASIGLLMSAYAVASMAVRPFLGWMAKEWGTLRVLGISLLLGAAAWALVPATNSTGLIFMLMILGGVGIGMGSPLTMVLAVDGVPLYERGLGLGIRQAANRIADFASAPLYGVVAGVLGLAATFFVAAGFALAGLAGMLRIGVRDNTTVAAISDESRP